MRRREGQTGPKRAPSGRHVAAIASVVAFSAVSAAACSSASEPAPSPVATVVDVVGEPPQFVLDALAALDAVEDELGAGQDYFEVTATDQITNVFVAVDGRTAAVPYAYVDGVLQDPAPVQSGAQGKTFRRADVSFDPTRIVAGVAAQLPESSVDALSIYGDGVGATYVLAATSPDKGGVLDIVVGPQGLVISVDPQ